MRAAIVLLLACSAVSFCQEGTKKLSRSEALSAVVSRVEPDFPTMAKQLRIEGAVELEAVLTEAGTIERVNIVSGNPVLTRPAVEALKKWRFSPVTENGKPVKAVAPVNFSFVLAH